MSALILLVHPDVRARGALERLLIADGYAVTSLSSFEAGVAFLDANAPDLLVANVRLGAFNGLHVAVRALCRHPRLPVIITHSEPDALFEHEAAQLGAQFIAYPSMAPAFLPMVRLSLESPSRRVAGAARWIS